MEKARLTKNVFCFSLPLIWFVLTICLVLYETPVSAWSPRDIEPFGIAKVKVKVNVLKDVDISDDEIKQIIDGANEIFKENGIQGALECDVPADVNRNVGDTGNNDDCIDLGETGQLNQNGQDELNKSDAGIKIYFARLLPDFNTGNLDPDIRGEAWHYKDVNGVMDGWPIIYLQRHSDTNDSKANDAAHEGSHIMTCGPYHIIDENTVADNTWHNSTDPNYLLYAQNPFPDPNGETKYRGIKLGIGEKREIQEWFHKHGKVKRFSNGILTQVPMIRDGWVDGTGETYHPYNDLVAGYFFSEGPFVDLEMDILFRGRFTNPLNTDLKLWCYFNTDSNNNTGITIGDMNGVDRILSMDVDFPAAYGYKGIVWTSIQKVGEPASQIKPGFVETIAVHGDGNETFVKDVFDGIHLNIQMSGLGQLADNVPSKIVANDYNSGDHDEVSFTLRVADHNQPTLELVNTRVEPGGHIAVRGYNFTPGSQVRIFLDDQQLGVADANTSGQIEQSFSMPSGLPFDDYFVTARDVSGRYDFSMVEYTNNIADLNADYSVNFVDLAYFAENWL